MEKIEYLSNNQLNILSAWVNQTYPQGNARATQPLGSRNIYYVNAVDTSPNN